VLAGDAELPQLPGGALGREDRIRDGWVLRHPGNAHVGERRHGVAGGQDVPAIEAQVMEAARARGIEGVPDPRAAAAPAAHPHVAVGDDRRRVRSRVAKRRVDADSGVDIDVGMIPEHDERGVFERAGFPCSGQECTEPAVVIFQDLERLGRFLGELPVGVPVAFEFRHESWADPAVHDVLRGRNAALVCADTDDEEQDASLVETADWGYLRLRRPSYGDEDLRRWGRRISSTRWKRAYVFFKHEDEGAGPRMAARFLELTAFSGTAGEG